MANVTRIKAKDPTQKKPKSPPKKQLKKTTPPQRKSEANVAKIADDTIKSKKSKTTKKPMPKWLAVITWPFRMIVKPFVALGHYIKASWHEIRQVRWPNRKATWKMTGAILIYAALIMALILLLDALFTFILNNTLGA